MSTRALYTFVDHDPNAATLKGDHCINIYKHHDGYPSGAADVLTEALKYAWPEPRFEHDEFAAAFCAAGKVEHGSTTSILRGGGVQIFPHGMPQRVAQKHCVIEYRYAIYFDGNLNKIMVQAFAVSCGYGRQKYHETWLFNCPLTEMVRTVEAIDKANAAENGPKETGDAWTGGFADNH